jgi:hypothetical protein
MSAVQPRQSRPELISADDPDLIVGKVTVPGAGVRVGLQCSGALAHMSPVGARRMAARFEDDEAKAAGLEWVAHALREAADEIEAQLETKQ